MVRKAAARILALALATTFASGCVSLSMFQGPETLDQGEIVGGVGAAAFSVPGDSTEDASVGLWPEAGVPTPGPGGQPSAGRGASHPPRPSFSHCTPWTP